METEQLAGLGIIGAAIYFFVSMFGGKIDAVAGSAVAGDVPVPDSKPAILNFPKDRKLTADEVFQLADYMTSKMGLEVDQFNLVAIAFVESSFRPWATRYEPKINDSSVGLMQTLVGTARDLYGKGYRAFGEPSKDLLKNPVVSMYFGASYFDWLHKSYKGKSLEWYVRAYNGGYGGAERDYTLAYWNKFKAARTKYAGGPYIKVGS